MKASWETASFGDLDEELQREKLVSILVGSDKTDPEKELLARHVLGEALAQASPEAVEEELEKLEGFEKRGFIRRFRGLVGIPALVIALALTIPDIWTFRAMTIFAGHRVEPEEIDFLIEPSIDLTESEQLFVFGKNGPEPFYLPPLVFGREKLLPYLKDNPDDPAALALYLSYDERASDEFYEIAEKIDPENAYFIFRQASQMFAEATSQAPWRSGISPIPQDAPHRVVNDFVLFEDGCALLRKGLRYQEYNNYSRSIHLRQLAMLPIERDLRTRMPRLMKGFGPRADLGLFETVEAIHIRVDSAMKKDDASEIRQLFSDSMRLAHLQTKGALFWDERFFILPYYDRVYSIFSNKEVSCFLAPFQIEQLGLLETECQFYWELEDKEIRGGGSYLPDYSAPRNWGFFAGYTGLDHYYVTSLASLPTDQELKPDRRFWHCLLERSATVLFSLVFGVMSIALVCARTRKKVFSKVVRTLVRSVTTYELLKWSLMITLFSLFVHFLWTRVSWFGVSKIAWQGSLYERHGLHLALLLLLLLAVSISLVRYQTRKKLTQFGFVAPLPFYSWWPVMFLILSYPFMCMEYIEKEWTQFLSVLFSIGGIVLLWFLWLFFSSLKASPLEKVVSAVVCRHCGIVFGFLTLFGALSIPIMKMRENYWFSRDEFNSTNKYELGGNRLGDEVARKLGQRMRDFHLSIEELER